jgi:hypothetical protein
MSTERAIASHDAPRSIAAHPPPANRIPGAAIAGPASANIAQVA